MLKLDVKKYTMNDNLKLMRIKEMETKKREKLSIGELFEICIHDP
jgi:hypothetical protein